MLLFWSCTLDSEPVLFSRDLSSRCLGAPCPGRPWRNAALCGVARNRLLVVGSRVVRGWQVWRVGSTLQSCEGGCFHCFSLLIFIIIPFINISLMLRCMGKPANTKKGEPSIGPSPDLPTRWSHPVRAGRHHRAPQVTWPLESSWFSSDPFGGFGDPLGRESIFPGAS